MVISIVLGVLEDMTCTFMALGTKKQFFIYISYTKCLVMKTKAVIIVVS